MKKILLITLFFFSTNMFSQTSKYIFVESPSSVRNYKKCTMQINVDDGVNPIALAKREYCSFVKLVEEFESKGYELKEMFESSRLVGGFNQPSVWFVFKKEE